MTDEDKRFWAALLIRAGSEVGGATYQSPADIAKYAVEAADALLAALDEEAT